MSKKKSRANKVITLSHEDVLLKVHPRVRFKHAFFSFFIVVVIMIGVYLIMPLSRLGVIYFDGLNALNRSELISLIEVDENELFLTLRLSEIQASIEAHPLVSEVNISRSWINRLRIEIVEHTVAVCALVEGDMFHILSDGVLIHENDGMRANCDELTIQGLSDEEVEAGVPSLFVRQLMNVDEEVKDLIQMIEYAPLYGDIHRLSLFMIDGNTVNVNSYTMHDYLNLYLKILNCFEPGQMGIIHTDVGGFCEPYK